MTRLSLSRLEPPGRLAVRVALPVAFLVLLAASLAAWKAHGAWVAAGRPLNGETLTSSQQLVPYGVSLAWRSLALGLGPGAVLAVAVAAVAWLFRKHSTGALTPSTGPARTGAWPVGVAALTGFLYGVAWRWTSDLRTVGDESSYLERGRALARLVRTLDLRGLFDWYQGTAHRPWPGLLPTYLGSVVGLTEPWLVGLQSAAVWALATWAMLRLARTLRLPPAVVALALALLVTQPLWRAESTAILADALLTSAVLLALAETVAFLRLPDATACLRVTGALALVPAIKPGGIVWAVVPLLLAAAVGMLAIERRAPWSWRLLRMADLAAMVGVAVPIALLLAGGPKLWSLVARHGVSVEALGYYDESVATVADRALWLLGVLPRLVTVPLLLLAIWGVVRGRGPARGVALAAVLLPLLVHAFLMESKSLRLVGAALAGLSVLALLGLRDLLERVHLPPRAVIAVAALGTLALLGADLLRVAPDQPLWAFTAPTGPGGWRQVHPMLVGANPRTDFGATWAQAAAQVRRIVTRECRLDATSPLFQDLHLVIDPRDSGYQVGLSPRSHYVPDLQQPFVDPLVRQGACLIVHTGQPRSWPDGHGRLHGEGLIDSLASLVQDRRDPLSQAFQPVARVGLPDAHEVVVYRRDREATLEERAAWADRLADWMPQAGVWAGFWRDVGGELDAAGQREKACTNWRRAAASRPMRGLVRCERVDVALCLDAVLPARDGAQRAQRVACPVDLPLWPHGVPGWLAQVQLPRP